MISSQNLSWWSHVRAGKGPMQPVVGREGGGREPRDTERERERVWGEEVGCPRASA